MEKINKRILPSILAVMILLLLIVPFTTAQAADKKVGTAVCTANNYVNVRKGPSTSYAKIGRLKGSAKVDVYKENNGWYYVANKSIKGWVSGRYLKVTYLKTKVTFDMLVNRDHKLSKYFYPADLVYVKDYNTSGNLTLKNNKMKANKTAIIAANKMLAAAKKSGVKGFYLASSYRTYQEQQALFNAKRKKDKNYGKDPGVPISTAWPGASEHQTGLALDISAVKAKSLSQSFADTDQAKWLAKNAYKYGFILRYQKGKEKATGIIYEPWHYRYVGVKLAKELHKSGDCLEEYYKQKDQ